MPYRLKSTIVNIKEDNTWCTNSKEEYPELDAEAEELAVDSDNRPVSSQPFDWTIWPISAYLTIGYNFSMKGLYKPFERWQKMIHFLHLSFLLSALDALYKALEKLCFLFSLKKHQQVGCSIKVHPSNAPDFACFGYITPPQQSL